MSDILQAADLDQFTGAETWFRHALARNVLYTEGVQYLAEKAGAYWLLDEIALAQLSRPIRTSNRLREFQAWKLRVRDRSATLTCEDGDDNVAFSKKIPFTDFPLPEVTLFVESDGELMVILLPSEH